LVDPLNLKRNIKNKSVVVVPMKKQICKVCHKIFKPKYKGEFFVCKVCLNKMERNLKYTGEVLK